MEVEYWPDSGTVYIRLMPYLPGGVFIDYTHETPDDNVIVDIKDGKVYGIEIHEATRPYVTRL